MYQFAIYVYLLGVVIASLFNKKVRKMWRGENQALDILRKQVDPNAKYIWVHAASLGEFEQGRPLMERIRTIREPTSFAISRLTRSATHGAFCAR